MTREPPIRAYDAVVFDNDGVVVRPTDREVIVDGVVEAFRTLGVDVDRRVARRTVASDDLPVETAREHGLDPEAFWRRRERAVSLAQRAAVRAGGKRPYDDVAALDGLDVPLGLVSNNQHETVAFLLDHHGLADRFETAYGRRPTLDGAARRKPNPSYVEQALDDLGADRALYVGDSEKDVVAARRAGIDAAYLRRQHVADVELAAEPRFDVPDLWTLVVALRGDEGDAAD